MLQMRKLRHGTVKSARQGRGAGLPPALAFCPIRRALGKRYGALIAKDRIKCNPDSSFLHCPVKKGVSGKELPKMSLVSHILLFFLKNMSVCMGEKIPHPKSKRIKSYKTLGGVIPITLISFSRKCLFPNRPPKLFRNGGKNTV